MKIIVGLGNPGRKYERTRHNVGFLVLDELARQLQTSIVQEKHHALIARARIGSDSVILAKPLTYMNDSGRAVAAILRDNYGSINDIIVVHDELDLPIGAVRVKIGGGHGGHNGIRSLIERLGSAEFIRVRIGISRPTPGMDSADYVLSPFPAEEHQAVTDTISRAAEVVRTIVQAGPERAMNIFNQK